MGFQGTARKVERAGSIYLKIHPTKFGVFKKTLCLDHGRAPDIRPTHRASLLDLQPLLDASIVEDMLVRASHKASLLGTLHIRQTDRAVLTNAKVRV